MAEMVIAIEELQKLSISHNDIKSENVMIDVDGHIVIVDFGLAEQFSSPRKLRNDWIAIAEICYQLITGYICFSYFLHSFKILPLLLGDVSFRDLCRGVSKKIAEMVPMLNQNDKNNISDFIQTLFDAQKVRKIGKFA